MSLTGHINDFDGASEGCQGQEDGLQHTKETARVAWGCVAQPWSAGSPAKEQEPAAVMTPLPPPHAIALPEKSIPLEIIFYE